MTNEPLDVADARQRYERAIAPEDTARIPFYAALLRAFEQDRVALELLASVRMEQRNPMLILASLQWLALGGHSVLGPIYGNVRKGIDFDPEAYAKKVLAVVHDDLELVRAQMWRSTQTNEAGRSAVLQAVIADLARGHDAINLLEVGCSAGINLHLDRFVVRESDDDQPLTLVCEDVTGPLNRALPSIARRVGIDPNPLHLEDRRDQRWLKACLWPEDHRRHVRFDAIVEAWPSWEPLEIHRGTASECFEEVLADLDDALTVVVNTWVLFYLSADERRTFLEAAHNAARRGGVATVSVETRQVEIPEFHSPRRAHQRGASRIVVARELSSPELWGWCHPHGRWLERA